MEGTDHWLFENHLHFVYLWSPASRSLFLSRFGLTIVVLNF